MITNPDAPAYAVPLLVLVTFIIIPGGFAIGTLIVKKLLANEPREPDRKFLKKINWFCIGTTFIVAMIGIHDITWVILIGIFVASMIGIHAVYDDMT